MRTNWHSLREFETLRAVISAGSTTAAARRLGISQSAVSRSISQLESRIGQMLFEREQGKLQPTVEALALNENLDPLFDALAGIDGAKWKSSPQEPLRVAAPPTLAHRFLVRSVASYLKANPDQMVSLEICTSDDLIGGIVDERFDLGITSADQTRAGLKLIPYRLSKGVCILPKGHKLTKHDVMRPEYFDGVDFIALTRRHRARMILDQHFARAGVSPRIIVETATSVAACEFVRNGLGITMTNPFPLISGSDDDIVVRPFEPDIAYRTSFAVSASRPPSVSARSFMRHIRLSTPKSDLWEPA
ncbi:LysR substrate-binding domain-containing protein [Pelagibius sp. Alg239-R121]|uniref:LysR substrate-binding domain-containing protein n=1 Tax=Pelagibius sp. Alg239-R121 TaxID=2993448 RepID=UPI0024A6E212|nr:LysR substrate-binding domain-containing protein [Pelagibius sp. Alg239-R121]